MHRLLASLFVLPLPACAIAFSAGVAPTPAPAKFQDSEHLSLNEEKKTEEAHAGSSRVFGMSLVFGGNPMDAGGLPKPPIPVTMLP